ncbi:MAG: nitroreductase family deazaflavin-dependent oxidoreductase [Acidobacteria bacterium]|nr:nitroreductase family deazaflavin-dependent oxidoreductase [Acidobacteriota bacterium]
MFAQMMTAFQSQFFSGVNLFAEPLIRAGVGNPLFWPTGTIVVETTGRKSGRKINLPVLATRIGEFVVFGTVRHNAQWLKNLAVNPEVRYWLGGQPREAVASVVTPNEITLSETLPPQANCLVSLLQQQSRLLGISFALLTPPKSNGNASS